MFQKRIQPPTRTLKRNELELIRYLKSLQLNLKKYFNEKQTQLKSQHEKIEILSPKNIMAKGYSIVYNNGKVIKLDLEKGTPQFSVWVGKPNRWDSLEC